MKASDPTRAVRELANAFPAALVNALKFTVITPMDASQVRNSMNTPETSATILKTMAATFFMPYPRRKPKVPPNPTWLTSKVARPFVSNGSACNVH